MKKRFIMLVLAASVFPAAPPLARSEDLGALFIGGMNFTASVYGFPAPDKRSVVTARIVYDVQTPPVYNLGNCDCATYRQKIYNGMAVEFGPLKLKADEYDIHVQNDYAPGGGADFFQVVFSSGYNPPFSTQLTVNDIPQPAGQLVVSLRDPAGGALSGAALPSLSQLQSFVKFEAFLRESPELDYVVSANLARPTSLPRITGDFNSNGVVDGADLLDWQRNVGPHYPSPADGDHNGVVNAADLGLWTAHFGENLGEMTQPLAEPAALWIALPLLLAGGLRRI